MPSTAVAHPLENLVGWERSMVAFLVEKERRSGSHRTVGPCSPAESRRLPNPDSPQAPF